MCAPIPPGRHLTRDIDNAFERDCLRVLWQELTGGLESDVRKSGQRALINVAPAARCHAWSL